MMRGRRGNSTQTWELSKAWTLSKEVLPEIGLLAEHYATSREPYERDVRSALQTRRPGRPFHVTVYQFCSRICALLEATPRQGLGGLDNITASLTELLQLLEREFLVSTVPKEILIGRSRIRFLVALTWTAQARQRQGIEKIAWLKENTKLAEPSVANENQLLKALKACKNELKLWLPLDITRIREDDDVVYQRPLEAWRKVAQICQSMENIAARWQCLCGQHDQVHFSINPCNTCAAGFVRSTIHYNQKGWKKHLLEIRDKHEAVYDELCEDLIAQGTAQKLYYAVQACGDCLGPSLLNQSWLTCSKPPPAVRLRLAVTLSHLYLGLGGGRWLPYQRTENMMYFSRHDSGVFTAPLFTFRSSIGDEADFLAACANPAMPNLVYFGILLLEVLTWEPCTPREIPKRLQSFERMHRDDLAGCEFILRAIICCTGSSQGNELRSGNTRSTIRDDTNVREKFISKVICNLEHVLLYAYGTKADDVLSSTIAEDAALEVEAQEGKERVQFVGSSKGSLKLLPGHGIPTTDNTMPMRVTDSTAGASRELDAADQVATLSASMVVLNDDTYRKETLDSKHALQSRKWFEKLKPLQRLLDGSQVSRIAVALLDTGVSFHSDVRDSFDGQYESYCFMNSNEPIELEQDDDGHGTHLASLCLKTNPVCRLYSGRIIANRRLDMLGETTEHIQRRIANVSKLIGMPASLIGKAIYHAVDEWKVKVISMSFGFDRKHLDLEEAIKYARDHNVLLYAAAGNNGIQEPIKYPASDHNTTCMLASSGLGVGYEGNPAGSTSQRFATLGVAVEGFVRDEPVSDFRSGTSQATIIGAAIASMILQILEDGSKEVQKIVTVRQYRDAVRALGTPEGMGRVFAGMCCQESAGHRNVILPWSLLDGCSRPELVLQSVCHKIVNLARPTR